MKKAVIGGLAGLGTAGLVGYALTLPPSTPIMSSSSAPAASPIAGSTAGPQTAAPGSQGSAAQSQQNSAPLFAAFSSPKEGWILYQTSQMLGKQTAIMSGAGCKVNNQELDVTYIVTNPDYNVAVYSDSRKLCYRTTMEGILQARKQQQAAVQAIGNVTGAQDTPYVKAASGVIAGLNATQYISQSSHGRVDKLMEGIDGTKSSPTISELWFTNDINVPARFSRLSANPKTSSGLPTQGVLLRMASTTGDGVKMVTLDTVAAKKMQIPPSTFSFPTGYKAASSEMEVAYGQGGEGLNQLFKQMAQPDTQQDMKDVLDQNADVGVRLHKAKENWQTGAQQPR